MQLYTRFAQRLRWRLLTALSVAVVLCYCKPAHAAAGISLAQAERPTAAAPEPVMADAGSLWDGFKLGGYTSGGFNLHPGGKADASINELSLFLRWEGTGRLRFFSEIEIERPLNWGDNDTFTSKNAYLDIERLYLDYNVSDKLTVRAGRFLTPAGRWNVIHAAPLQWTTTRPLVTSRLFPESINGVMLYGATPVSDMAFEYTFYVDTLQQDSRDKEAISYKDARGMRLGIVGKINVGMSLLDITENEVGGERHRIFGVDFVTKHNGWEASGEFMQRYTTHDSDGGSGAYLQGVAPLGNNWFAVARLENFKRPLEGSSERWLVGTAWRMTPKHVIKMEYVGGDKERVESPKGFLASIAILF